MTASEALHAKFQALWDSLGRVSTVAEGDAVLDSWANSPELAGNTARMDVLTRTVNRAVSMGALRSLPWDYEEARRIVGTSTYKEWARQFSGTAEVTDAILEYGIRADLSEWLDRARVLWLTRKSEILAAAQQVTLTAVETLTTAVDTTQQQVQTLADGLEDVAAAVDIVASAVDLTPEQSADVDVRLRRAGDAVVAVRASRAKVLSALASVMADLSRARTLLDRQAPLNKAGGSPVMTLALVAAGIYAVTR